MKNRTFWALAVFAAGWLTAPANAGGARDGWLPIAEDKRQTIPVSAVDRHHLLYEMRTMLHGLLNIQRALARHDMAGVALQATEMGGLVDKLPNTLRARMPEPFMMLGEGLKRSFAGLASAAAAKDEAAIQVALAEALSYCSGCHDTYRFHER
jgi:hypothetical protein